MKATIGTILPGTGKLYYSTRYASFGAAELGQAPSKLEAALRINPT